MPHFDRFDICEAHLALEWDYNVGGVLWERWSNRWHRRSTGVQLARMGFRPGASFAGWESLSENGKAIYAELVARYQLDREQHRWADWVPHMPRFDK